LEKEHGKLQDTYDKLLVSENKFRVAFKTSPDAIAIIRVSDGLFLEISKLYVSLWKDSYLEGIRTGNLDNVADYFLQRASKSARAETNNGCLIFNTLSDEQLDAPDIRKEVSGFLRTIQNSFASALHNERAQGTLIGDLDINEASQFLLSSLIGMNMLIKARQSNKAALPTALALQKTILSWRITA
jgi:hypothetical protein